MSKNVTLYLLKNNWKIVEEITGFIRLVNNNYNLIRVHTGLRVSPLFAGLTVIYKNNRERVYTQYSEDLDELKKELKKYETSKRNNK